MNLIMKPCYDFWNIWYEPYDMNLLIWHYDIWYVIWFPVWYPSQICFPSHEGNMAVSLMHQWHDSSVVEWCSTPSLICYLLWAQLSVYYGQYYFCGGVWMHPRSDLFCSDMIWYDMICLVHVTVCAIHSFHISGS